MIKTYVRLLLAILGLVIPWPSILLAASESVHKQASSQRSIVSVGRFSENDLVEWESQSFSGETQYKIVRDDDSSDLVLKAISASSASGLVKRQRIDLRKTPYLHWRWKIAKQLSISNERKKTEDDYAARVYVIVDGGFFPWRTMAINYVWSHGVLKGQHWDNAFAPNQSKMISVRSKEDGVGLWYSEVRNVGEDFKALYGKAVTYIDVIAIMTDTDNTSLSAESFYGDVYFSESLLE